MKKVCLFCKKEFSRKAGMSDTTWLNRKKFCSCHCMMDSLHLAHTGVRTGEYRKCLVCNKEFYVLPSTIKRRPNGGIYCSQKCMWKSPSRNGSIAGSKHYNWRGGVTTKNRLLRDKFSKTIRIKVFERDNYMCQICGKSGISLHVDHIVRWSEDAESRFDVNNCRTLCMMCHYKSTFLRSMPSSVRHWGINK
jgi:hypothetical protein